MIALVETTSEGSAIVLVLDTQGPFGDYDWHYTYDDLGRMTSACSDWLNGECFGNMWQYQHDAVGNLLLFDHWDAEARRTVTAQYVINGANQVECADNAGGDRHCDDGELLWEYDPYGHLKYDGVTHYTYDAADRLSTVTIWDDEINADVTTTYTYNGDGQRVAQSDNSDIVFPPVTTYTLDVVTSAVLAETTRGTTVHYLSGLATIAQSDGITTTYLQYDGAGSVRQITNPSGVVQYSQTFDPFGNLYRKTAGNGSTIGFAGGIHDANGLVYANGKYYAPTQGQFIRQQLDVLDRAFSQLHYGQTGTPMTWDAFQAKIPQVRQDIINRSEMTGLSPTMEFLGEAFLFNAKTLWEGPMVQNTVSLGQVCVWPNSNPEQRFFASREIALNTAMPIAEFGLWMYSPVTFMFPTTTADVMMKLSARDIVGRAWMAQYADDAANFAKLRALQAELAATTAKYLPNGLTIIGDNSAYNARIADAHLAQAEADAKSAMPQYHAPLGGNPVYNLLSAGEPVFRGRLAPIPVDYGTTEMSIATQRLRLWRYDVLGREEALGGDVAVFRIEGDIPQGLVDELRNPSASLFSDLRGDLAIHYGYGARHAEQALDDLMTKYEMWDQVTAVYSELHPCSDFPNCLGMLNSPRYHSLREITFSFHRRSYDLERNLRRLFHLRTTGPIPQ